MKGLDWTGIYPVSCSLFFDNVIAELGIGISVIILVISYLLSIASRGRIERESLDLQGD